MTTSVNQPRPTAQPQSSGGLFKAIFILAAIVLSVIWLLNSYKAGQPIKLSEPLPKADPVVEQTVTLSMALPERCMDVSQPVARVAGSALKTPTDYVPCATASTLVDVVYKATNSKDGYIVTDSDGGENSNGDKFLCSGIPHEAADIAQCKAVQ